MSCLKENKMKFLSMFNNLFAEESYNDPYVRIAEVEYSKEFRWFVKSHGRRPNKQEALWIIGR